MTGRLSLALASAVLASWCALAASESTPTPAPKVVEDFSEPLDVAEVIHLGTARPVFVRLHVFMDGKPYKRVWSEFMDHLFKTLDTNKDGVLSKDELLRLPPPTKLFNQNLFGGTAQVPFNSVDTNGDGKVTRQELAAYFRRSNFGAPYRFQFIEDQRDPYEIAFGRREQGRGAGEITRALLDLLDTNKDGKLSRVELAAAPETLRKLDTDEDEMVSFAEFTAALPHRPRPQPTAPRPRAMPAPAKDPPPPSFLMVEGRTDAVLAKHLLTRYGSSSSSRNLTQLDGLAKYFLSRYTSKETKRLTRKDIGLDEATFNQLDKDGDGELDTEELAHFTQRLADLELTIRVGKIAKGEAGMALAEAGGKPAALAGQTRRNKEMVIVNLDVSEMEFETRTVDSYGRNNTDFFRQVYEAQFDQADKDSNGYLDEKEAKASGFFRESFQAMDLDGDGKVSKKEMLAYLDRLLELQSRALLSQITVSAAESSRGLFGLIDTDRDGRLSVRELRNAVKLLERLDRNGDGFLSVHEVPRTYVVTVTQGPFGNTQFFGGNFDPSQLFKSPPEPTVGPLWFRKMDLNRDGDVSRREFIGSKEEFDRIDTDGDGLISAEEADRYDALRRQQKRAN